MIDENYLTNIKFTKIRHRSYKITLCKNRFKEKRIGLKVPSVRCPFGIEHYLNKKIVNIELTDYKKRNDVGNIYSIIKQIDNFMKKLSWNNVMLNGLINLVPYDMLNNIKNKRYMSCIKMRFNNFDPLLRTHIKKNENIFCENKDYDMITTNPYDIKGSVCDFIITVDNLWVSTDSYGLVIYLDKCNITQKAEEIEKESS
jgi:hypothetical protein